MAKIESQNDMFDVEAVPSDEAGVFRTTATTLVRAGSADEAKALVEGHMLAAEHALAWMLENADVVEQISAARAAAELPPVQGVLFGRVFVGSA